MSNPKCHKCGLVMDRQGEKRPSIGCKQCKDEYCGQCAKVTAEICTLMKAMENSIWTCDKCEARVADLKSVIDSVNSMKTELSTLKQGQVQQQTERAEQKVERAKVLESLKAVEKVMKRLDKVEETQDKHGQKLVKHDNDLSSHEEAIKKNKSRTEEGEKKMKILEDRMQNVDQKTVEMRHCNAVAREVREMEKREKNLVLFNVPEPTNVEEEDRKKMDTETIIAIFEKLGFQGLRPAKFVRMGTAGKYPRKILTTLTTADECVQVVRKGREMTSLDNGIFITGDRTYNQRQEARLFRMEKENEERGGPAVIANGGGGGRGGRGRGRPRGRGTGRGGRGGRGQRDADVDSRKRRNSNDRPNESDDDESKRRRTGEGDTQSVNQPSQSAAKATAAPSLELGAVGGSESDF